MNARPAKTTTVSLEELKEQRPVDEDHVTTLRDEMLAQSRAHRLAELRRTRHLTQREVAAELGIDQSRVSRIERGDLGRTELGTLAAFVRALGGELEVNVRVDEERHQLL
jgi:predicted XRE-type DNA-binding protein